jgi:hypothetical protein
MGDILAHPAFERESLGGRRRGMGRISIECHLFVQPLQHEMQHPERIVATCVAAGGGKRGDI